MRVLILCRESELPWYGWGYGPALQKLGAQVSYIGEQTPQDADLKTLLAGCPTRPSLILRPEFPQFPLPWGLTEVDIPTVLFQEDTYAYTERRIRWSLLFDHIVLYHPGYEDRFRQAGHPNPLTLPFGVARELFDQPEQERVLDVGWVGRCDWDFYSQRRRILPELAGRFRMNDWRRHYSHEGMAEVYRRSKIVVNVARDDYPQDANMRAFEAMAAGALLITRVPSELTELGFEEGVHFVGYRQMEEIVPLAHKYLQEGAARQGIARAARQKVLGEHTYDCRAAALLRSVEQHVGSLCAPARRWQEAGIRLLYLDSHSSHAHFDLAWHEFRKLCLLSSRKALSGASLLGRAWVRDLRASWARPKSLRPWETGPWPRETAGEADRCLDEHGTAC